MLKFSEMLQIRKAVLDVIWSLTKSGHPFKRPLTDENSTHLESLWARTSVSSSPRDCWGRSKAHVRANVGRQQCAPSGVVTPRSSRAGMLGVSIVMTSL